MLTVWDWEAGHTLLRSKAFSQEVYNVSFNPYADGSLITSGELHCLVLPLTGHVHKEQAWAKWNPFPAISRYCESQLFASGRSNC